MTGPTVTGSGVIWLAAHDPLPEQGPYVAVLRRFGEDDPNALVIELIVDDGASPPRSSLALGGDGEVLGFDQALNEAVAEAARRGIARVYGLDRTKGMRERDVIAHHGDHGAAGMALDDSDPEDGEAGSDLRDRKPDAGYF